MTLLALLVLCLCVFNPSDWAQAAKPTSSALSSSAAMQSKRLAYKRIVAEWKDILKEELTLDKPFNNSKEEVSRCLLCLAKPTYPFTC